jgi:hypothetical protein
MYEPDNVKAGQLRVLEVFHGPFPQGLDPIYREAMDEYIRDRASRVLDKRAKLEKRILGLSHGLSKIKRASG